MPLYLHHISFLPFRANTSGRTISTCYLVFYHQPALIKVITVLLLLDIMKHFRPYIRDFPIAYNNVDILSFLMIYPTDVSLTFSCLIFLLPLCTSLKLIFPGVLHSSIFSLCPLPKSNLMHYHSYNFTFRLMTHISIPTPGIS